jgi:hypothetical protein
MISPSKVAQVERYTIWKIKGKRETIALSSQERNPDRGNRAAYWGTSAIAVGWRVIADGAHRD